MTTQENDTHIEKEVLEEFHNFNSGTMGFAYSNESNESRKSLLRDIEIFKGCYWFNSNELDSFMLKFIKDIIQKTRAESKLCNCCDSTENKPMCDTCLMIHDDENNGEKKCIICGESTEHKDFCKECEIKTEAYGKELSEDYLRDVKAGARKSALDDVKKIVDEFDKGLTYTYLDEKELKLIRKRIKEQLKKRIDEI